MHKDTFDPRPYVRSDFDTLLSRLEDEDASRVNIFTQKPYKVTVTIEAKAKGREEMGKVAVSWHQHAQDSLLKNLRFVIRQIEIGQKYIRFYLVPDWGYWIDQKKDIQEKSKTLDMEDIIPI